MIAMFLIIGVAAVVMMIVMIGTDGNARTGRHPELTQRLARAKQHLNGEAEVPARFERLVNRHR